MITIKSALGLGVAALSVIVFSAPASAAVVLTDVNGPNLTTAIKASTTNTQQDNTVVFGCTANNGQCDNVTFTANTAVHITDGAGYASISDVLNQGGVLTQLTSDPVPNFSAYQFSIQLNQASNILVEYQLASGGAFLPATFGDITNPFNQNANQLADYQITATSGELLSAIRVTTTTPGASIFLFKQNSINLAPGAVPEPSTWAMMLMGFGAVGFGLRRRKAEGKGARVRIAYS